MRGRANRQPAQSQQRCAPRHGFIAANRRIRGWLLLGRSGGLPAREGRHLRHFRLCGGAADTAEYDTVSSGTTGHAESVQVVYDPSKISYGQLLKIYFAVAHDPTELNRQGPDSGTQYRSEIYTLDAEQKRIAESYISQLDAAHVYPQKIVTRVEALPAFYPAEAHHQNFAELHPYNPYILINDRPKVEHLKEQFPALYRNSIM